MNQSMYMNMSFDLVVQDEFGIEDEVFDFVRYVPWPGLIDDYKNGLIGLGRLVSDEMEDYEDEECDCESCRQRLHHSMSSL